MRMVIDSSTMKDDTLREYLSTFRKNIAVVTDYLMIEALKDDPLRKIFGLMKILTDYPELVIVLMSLRHVSALKGRRCGMTGQMLERS